MKEFMKLIPIPICGLILAIVSFGNLLKEDHFYLLGNIFGYIGISAMLLFLLKVILLLKHTSKGLTDAIIASVAPTFTMAIMVICTYLTALQDSIFWVKYLWLCAVILHVLLVLYFTLEHVIRPIVRFDNIYPSWFIVYVGFGVITVTAGNFFPIIGDVFFWIALILYLLLLPVILYRVFFIKKMPESTLPLIAVITAPGSLCLTGYLTNFLHPNIWLIVALFVLSQSLYFVILVQLPKLLKLPFYPSYAALTFPLVISATALTKTNHFFGIHNGFFFVVQVVETIIAFVIILYVLAHYIIFLKNIQTIN